jgi:hypothetical protein
MEWLPNPGSREIFEAQETLDFCSQQDLENDVEVISAKDTNKFKLDTT